MGMRFDGSSDDEHNMYDDLFYNFPAIESAHAVSYAMKLAPTMSKDQIIVINISGRGDKDCAAIARYRGEDIHE